MYYYSSSAYQHSGYTAAPYNLSPTYSLSVLDQSLFTTLMLLGVFLVVQIEPLRRALEDMFLVTCANIRLATNMTPKFPGLISHLPPFATPASEKARWFHRLAFWHSFGRLHGGLNQNSRRSRQTMPGVMRTWIPFHSTTKRGQHSAT